MKLSLTKTWLNSWEFGGALSGVLDGDSNYGVWAAYALGRYALGAGSFQFGANLGIGLGHNAPILHSDLKADALLSPYALVALDALWQVSDRGWLGVELSDEQLSVIYLGGVLKWSL